LDELTSIKLRPRRGRDRSFKQAQGAPLAEVYEDRIAVAQLAELVRQENACKLTRDFGGTRLSCRSSQANRIRSRFQWVSKRRG
jgi:hypothetical protein